MKETFQWNPHADQPHNVGSRAERLVRHLAHAPSYLGQLGANLKILIPALLQYRFLRSIMLQFPVRIEDPFAVSVAPVPGRAAEIAGLLDELGVTRTLVRIPSWEEDRLDNFAEFIDLLRDKQKDVLIALLQRRQDVLELDQWERFLRQVFLRFSEHNACFQIGQAWNRTKWGVWDHKEYIRLAQRAEAAAQGLHVKLVGPSVIDFEFHLYPPVLKKVSFDIVSSLLYVDRSGPPEATQFGWDTLKKLALLRAIVDKCIRPELPLWITEVNWPLKDTGKYSPAVGRPNVDEEDQADYLVRYYLLCLCTGWVERIYWWQLVAPGYGLIDSRPADWRRRPAFYALQTMRRFCAHSVFQGQFVDPDAWVFNFCKGKEVFAVAWCDKGSQAFTFPSPIKKVISRDGAELEFQEHTVTLDGSPRYIVFESEKPDPGRSFLK